ncbi:MAG: rRNA maturation RNase YbeY [bacterium]|nr:rRNA maturation RNase YbeY [bacterium]
MKSKKKPARLAEMVKMTEVAKVAENFSLLNKTKGELPRLPFALIRDAVLGRDYDLSLVFIGDRESQKLNIKTRGMDYIPNVLSFELDENAGEIFINPFEAKRQAGDFDRTFSKFVGYLYIHGLVHLKGMRHGSTMERTEAKFRKQFGV